MCPNGRERQVDTVLGPAWAVLVSTVPSFGGEDPLAPTASARWHHQELTAEAARTVGWSVNAAAELAFHSVAIDWYLYNPVWCLAGGPARIRAALAGRRQLRALHFDDLTSIAQIRHMWRRYTRGTLAGLLWAARANDVSAARNIVGVSLHAMQDFYSHSNWIDDPARRQRTWLTWEGAREDLPLYTGSYEESAHLGINCHGEIGLTRAAFHRLPRWFAAARRGAIFGTAQPAGQQSRRSGPPSGLRHRPPLGINLDSRWQAQIGARRRELADLDGDQAFTLARSLALRESIAWLRIIDDEMNAQPGNARFWAQVCGESVAAPRHDWPRPFEELGRLPFTFLSAGHYPPPSHEREGEWFLRVTLTTSAGTAAGTRPNIRVRVDDAPACDQAQAEEGSATFGNRFSGGGTRVLCLGPFDRLPRSIELVKVSSDLAAAKAGHATWRALRSAAVLAGIVSGARRRSKIGPPALPAVVWSPRQLMALSDERCSPFRVALDDPRHARWQLEGRLWRVSRTQRGGRAFSAYEISLQRLTSDPVWTPRRAAARKKPTLLAVAVNHATGRIQQWRSKALDEAPPGSGHTFDHLFTFDEVPDLTGYLTLALLLLPGNKSDPDQALADFARRVGDPKPGLGQAPRRAVNPAIDGRWQLIKIQIDAFTRGDRARLVPLLDADCHRWRRAGAAVRFTLTPADPLVLGSTIAHVD